MVCCTELLYFSALRNRVIRRDAASVDAGGLKKTLDIRHAKSRNLFFRNGKPQGSLCHADAITGPCDRRAGSSIQRGQSWPPPQGDVLVVAQGVAPVIRGRRGLHTCATTSRHLCRAGDLAGPERCGS